MTRSGLQHPDHSEGPATAEPRLGRHRTPRRRLGAGLLAAAVLTIGGGATVAALGTDPAPAHADALCDQMRAQYGSNWPCISVPTNTFQPTTNTPAPTAGADGAGSGGPQVGSNIGPGPGEGNGTPIVTVPGQAVPQPPAAGGDGNGSSAPTNSNTGGVRPTAPQPVPPGDNTVQIPVVLTTAAPAVTTVPGAVSANPQLSNPPRVLDSGSTQPDIPLAAWVVAGAAAFAAANPRVRRAAIGGGSAKSGSSDAPQSVGGGRFGYVQAAAIRPQPGPDDPKADARVDNEDHDPPASSSTSGSGDNANANGSGGTGGDSQFTPQSPPAAVSPAPAPAPEPAPAPAPAPDVEPSPDPQAEQPSFTLPNYVAPGGDKGIEADPVFFLIDDAAEAAILALLLSAIMATIISEYGWEWVRTHPDQLPDLMIDKLPGWLADQVDKVKDWISQYFTKNNEPGDGNSADVPHPEWGSGNHTNQLPTSGNVPYVPPRNIQRNPDGSPVPNNGSFPDKKGRIWTWDKSGHGGEHWDVTDPKTGKHVNVYPNGHTR